MSTIRWAHECFVTQFDTEKVSWLMSWPPFINAQATSSEPPSPAVDGSGSGNGNNSDRFQSQEQDRQKSAKLQCGHYYRNRSKAPFIDKTNLPSRVSLGRSISDASPRLPYLISVARSTRAQPSSTQSPTHPAHKKKTNTVQQITPIMPLTLTLTACSDILETA